MKKTCNNVVNGLNYLIPNRWWQIYNEMEPSESENQVSEDQSPSKPPLISHYINSFAIDFQQHITKQIQQITKISKFNSVFIIPEIKSNRRWKIINPEVWKQIQSLSSEQINIPILYDSSKPLEYFSETLVQIQLIFVSQSKCILFVGYFPENKIVSTIVEEIGQFLGFSNFHRANIIFSDIVLPQDLCFDYLSMFPAKEFKEGPIQIKNLYHKEEKNFFQGLLDLPQNLEPVLRRYQTDDDLQNERRSLSTKMNTPRFHQEEDSRQISRIKKIIHSSKHPEQIQCLREKAQKSVKETIIQIPIEGKEKYFQEVLEDLAKIILSRVGGKE